MLGAIPWVLNRKPVMTLIQSAPIANYLGLKRISIGLISGLQYSAFVIGIACLSGAVLLRQLG